MERKLHRNRRRYSQLQNYMKKMSSGPQELFPEADQYPSFFEENLLDEDRTIKFFYQHPYPHQTIFYFQLLKLTYETEDTDYENYLTKIYDLLDNPEFHLVTPPQHNPYYLGIKQSSMKRMLHEFLQEMGEGNSTVYQLLSKYPIVDKIFVFFMRTILILGKKCQGYEDEVDPVELYQFLSEYFEIDITYYTNCLKFDLSDVFVYFESEHEIYVAYLTPKPSQHQLPSSNQFYQPAGPEEAFNISSVHQMVSEIDIPVEEECFTLSKKNQSFNDTEEIQYEYSQSQEVRRPSKSLQENSQIIKFSHLIGEDSILQNLNVIKSNKILEREVMAEKKSCFKVNTKADQCFQIKEAPMELENASSPVATPKELRFGDRFQFDEREQDSTYSRYQQEDKVKDHFYEQDFIETGFTDKGFKKNQDEQENRQPKDTWADLKRQTEHLLGNSLESQTSKGQKNLKSLYELRSIKTIVSCNDSYMLDTPAKSSFNPSFQPSFNPSFQPSFNPSFQPSFHQSRKQTSTRLISPVVSATAKQNQYTKYGYVNNNISNEFTSSILLRQMNQPHKGKIEALKSRARKERKNIQNMLAL